MDLKKSSQFVLRQFQTRNETSRSFVAQHCGHLARLCRRMARRFGNGGRLLAFGKGCWATDAQRVSALFLRPALAGKRALPALDVSASPRAFLEQVLRREDMLMGFCPPAGDREVHRLVSRAAKKGALTVQWPGRIDNLDVAASNDDPFIHQEITQILCHTLWETVHVFFGHEERESDLGASSFLYPFLTRGSGVEPEDALADVSNSIVRKAEEDVVLRRTFARESAKELARAAKAMRQRIAAGGTILIFADDASSGQAADLALDCVAPPPGLKPLPAVSPATAFPHVADDEAEGFLPPHVLASGRPQDVAFGISVDGNSPSVCHTLKAARERRMLTVCLVGCGGGEMLRERLAEHTLSVPSSYPLRLREIHASICHVLRKLLTFD